MKRKLKDLKNNTEGVSAYTISILIIIALVSWMVLGAFTNIPNPFDYLESLATGDSEDYTYEFVLHEIPSNRQAIIDGTFITDTFDKNLDQTALRVEFHNDIASRIINPYSVNIHIDELTAPYRQWDFDYDLDMFHSQTPVITTLPTTVSSTQIDYNIYVNLYDGNDKLIYAQSIQVI